MVETQRRTVSGHFDDVGRSCQLQHLLCRRGNRRPVGIRLHLLRHYRSGLHGFNHSSESFPILNFKCHNGQRMALYVDIQPLFRRTFVFGPFHQNLTETGHQFRPVAGQAPIFCIDIDHHGQHVGVAGQIQQASLTVAILGQFPPKRFPIGGQLSLQKIFDLPLAERLNLHPLQTGQLLTVVQHPAGHQKTVALRRPFIDKGAQSPRTLNVSLMGHFVEGIKKTKQPAVLQIAS